MATETAIDSIEKQDWLDKAGETLIYPTARKLKVGERDSTREQARRHGQVVR
ncbi:MAG: hypothetical protein M3R15_02595 [Acidobacteriota bacterium]|nr:hypothetical protein [Acidobacteriota bacterium]